MELKFVCPDCGETQLEEVMPSATVTSRIVRLDSAGDHDYADEKPTIKNDQAGEDPIWYQCWACGWVVKDKDADDCEIHDCVTLADWLKKQPYNRRKRK